MEDHNYAKPPNLSPKKPLSKKALIFEDNYKSASEAFQGCMKDIELDGRSISLADVLILYCIFVFQSLIRGSMIRVMCP